MKSLEQFAQEIIKLYNEDKLSLRQIATKYKTYPLAIFRLLKKFGVQIRDKSDAAREAISSGRSTHPTKGKKLKQEVKDKIGKGVYNSWSNMDAGKREDISNKHKDNWKQKSPQEKEELSKKSHMAIAESARTGSKLEKFLLDALSGKGYNCFAHTKILQNVNLEVDLCIPDLQIAIEVDGHSHFEPIWGDEVLEKTKLSDTEKNGQLAANGYKVIRLRYTKGHVSNILKQQTLSALVDKIEEARNSTDNLYIVTI